MIKSLFDARVVVRHTPVDQRAECAQDDYDKSGDIYMVCEFTHDCKSQYSAYWVVWEVGEKRVWHTLRCAKPLDYRIKRRTDAAVCYNNSFFHSYASAPFALCICISICGKGILSPA